MCIENLIRIGLVTESLNVGHDGRADIPPLEPGWLALQTQEPARSVGAPRNTPDGVIGRLNKELNVILADPALKPQLAGFGSTVLAGTPADFGKLIANETQKWAKVIKFAGVKPE